MQLTAAVTKWDRPMQPTGTLSQPLYRVQHLARVHSRLRHPALPHQREAPEAVTVVAPHTAPIHVSTRGDFSIRMLSWKGDFVHGVFGARLALGAHRVCCTPLFLWECSPLPLHDSQNISRQAGGQQTSRQGAWHSHRRTSVQTEKLAKETHNCRSQ